MPVLPLATTLFPEQLLEDPTLGQTRSGAWWVAHTKPRAEKTLAGQLLLRSIPFFLPVYSRRIRRRKQPLTSYLTLFPGYLFLHADEEERVHALTTNYVVRTLVVADQDELHVNLKQIHQMMVSGVPIAPEDRLQAGMLVEICSGPLKGLEGKIIHRGNQRRFVVGVDFLRRGASVEIDGWALRPVDGHYASRAAC